MNFSIMHCNFNFIVFLCIIATHISVASIITQCQIPKCLYRKAVAPSFSVMNMDNKPLRTNLTGFSLTPPSSNECYIRASEVIDSYQSNGTRVKGVLVLRCPSNYKIHLLPDIQTRLPNVLFQIQIEKCLLTADSLNILSRHVRINQMSFINSYPLVDHTYCDGSSVAVSDCGLWGSVTAIGIILPRRLNSVNISKIFQCNETFPNVHELLFRRWDLNQHLSYLRQKFPNVQDLQISNSYLKTSPTFPWNSQRFRFNYNMSLSETALYDSASIFHINIAPNMWKRSLNLNSNDIHVLTGFRFEGHLDMLKLSRNGLLSVSAFTFSGLQGLQHLDLSVNLLSDIPSNVLRGLTSLRHLNLHANLLSVIPDDMFYDNTELVYLDLSNNSISIIGTNAFSKLHHLEELRLEYNRIMTLSYSMLPAFSVSFKSLVLDGNPLRELPEAIFYFKTLYDVSLRNTIINFENFTKVVLDLNFSQLAEGNAQGLTVTETDLVRKSPRKLKRIDLTGSAINNLHLRYFGTDMTTVLNSRILKLKLLILLKYFQIILNDNPIICDCRINHLSRFVKRMLAEGLLKGNEYFFNDWKCASPRELKYKPVLQVPETETYCVKDVANCPTACTCYERSVSGVTIVDCRNVGLKELPKQLPGGILDLWFQNNNITNITRTSYLPRTRQLLLTGNKNIKINTKTIQNLDILKLVV